MRALEPMKLAIFDIDGVLVRCSSERAFWRYLLRSKRQRPRQLLAYVLSLLRLLPVAGIHALKANKSYLAGLDRSDIEPLGKSFIGEWAPGNWNHAAVERLKQHQKQGDSIVLLSGTLDFLASPLADLLGVRHVVATLPSHREGVYRAKPPVIHPFASAKRAIGEKLVRTLDIDWQDVTAYGDSYHDLALLEAAGRPVAVRPDRRLKRTALARGWEILDAEVAVPSGANQTAPSR